VARTSAKWGERPHAFIVLNPRSVYHGKEPEFLLILRAFAKGKLPGFAIPDSIEFVKELEKSSTGKVSKKTMRDALRVRDSKK
jgi:acyl-CoA synthetase (AMP-forming)/AMP-acid ligase II